MKTQTGYMGIDQYGTTYHLGYTRHPRKALLNKLGRRSARKMYTDKKAGGSVHSGYVVGPFWVRLFTVTPYEKEATTT